MMSPVQIRGKHNKPNFRPFIAREKKSCASHLEAGVGPRVADVVESPRLRRGVHRFLREIRGHAISPGKLEDAHGDGTLLSGGGDKKEG